MQTNLRPTAKYTRYFQEIKEAYIKKPVVQTSVKLLLSLVTISFFAVFALRPTLNTISDLLAQIKSQEEIAQKLNDKLENLEKAQVIWNTQQQNIALLDQALPQKANSMEYIRQIESLATIPSLKIISLSLAKTALVGKNIVEEETDEKDTPIKDTNKISLSFSVEGSYSSLSNFLKDVENLRRVIDEDSVSIRLAAGEGEQQTQTLLLAINTDVPFFEKGALLKTKAKSQEPEPIKE